MKKIIITWATSWIWLETAKYLSEKKYQIIITWSKRETVSAALKQLPQSVEWYVCDSQDMKSIEKFTNELIGKSYTIDGIFFNAGIFEAASFHDTTEDIYDRTMNINVKWVFFTLQSLVSQLNNPCSIVFNTSIVTKKSFAFTSAYSVSKSALKNLSKVLNTELADIGVRVNIVSPWVTRTPIQEKSWMNNSQIQDLIQNIENSSPLGRIISPIDIAPIVEFLLSDSSLPLRDQTIHVEWGSTL